MSSQRFSDTEQLTVETVEVLEFHAVREGFPDRSIRIAVREGSNHLGRTLYSVLGTVAGLSRQWGDERTYTVREQAIAAASKLASSIGEHLAADIVPVVEAEVVEASEGSGRRRYPAGHPKAGQFMPSNDG